MLKFRAKIKEQFVTYDVNVVIYAILSSFLFASTIFVTECTMHCVLFLHSWTSKQLSFASLLLKFPFIEKYFFQKFSVSNLLNRVYYVATLSLFYGHTQINFCSYTLL